MTDFRVDRIRTRTGATIDLPPAGVLCVVGGNNVGKSQLLRDVSECLQGYQSRAVILSDVDFTLNISEDVESWARSNSVVQSPPGQPETFTPPGGGQAWQLPQLQRWLADPSGENLGHVIGWFLRTLDSAQRVGVAIGGMGQPGMEATGNPIHELFIDGDLESELSKICLKTFTFPLTMDRANGNVQLRVGKPGIDSPPLQHPTREYAESVAALRLLSEQGDGVKNYLGMVLHLMTSRASVTVIDEPEAFLHPAQARSLGRHLGTQALSRGLQLLTATHDRDFVLGLLETNCPVTFVRLQRYQDNTSAATLSPERVKSIWDRPLLRYSNVLQGLFHRTVVVCESDGDCRWYAAVLDELGRRADFAAEEVLFVPAGGKSQIPQCVDALEGLDVGAFVAVDFDALLDPPYLKTLLASAGATGDDLLSRATNIVKQLLTTEQRARAKEFGLDGLPHGDLTRLAQDLVADLRDARVLVLPGGELESYDRSIGGHGPAWVSGALAAGRHLASPIAEEFLSPVVAAVRGLE